ncbi:hypothetical protein B0T09DRAFT_31007 [Sordaria sp. MPI-SDFR-AT-0083]|nr:hypothetical protein B0T09DRAFT_31007 [Sordaria sp. MPI-SDFR-AT-0083]
MQFKTLFISTLAGLAAAHGTEDHSAHSTSVAVSAPISTAPILSTGTAPLPTGTGGVISSSAGGIYSNSTFITKPSAGTEEVTATVTSKAGGASSTGAVPSASGTTNGALDRKSEFGMVVIGLVVAAGFAI